MKPDCPAYPQASGRFAGFLTMNRKIINQSLITMNITGTHFNYYQICHRKLWLFANGVQMEHTSELVDMGRLIHETTYPFRTERYKEIELDGIKIDYFDAKNKIIHEIKKSDKRSEAHEWQLKYYIYVLGQHGTKGVTGILEYPKIRQREEIVLTEADEDQIRLMLHEIEQLIATDQCPSRLPVGQCKNCSYFDFCYSSETEES